jgi:hypothetical protein
MGCGNSFDLLNTISTSTNIIQFPLNKNISFLTFQTEDEVSKLKLFCQSVEEVRHAIIDEKDNISLSTGACSYKKNQTNIEKCIKSISWKLSSEVLGKLSTSDFNFLNESSLFTISNESKFSKDSRQAVTSIYNYIVRVEKLKERLLELNNQKMFANNIIINLQKVFNINNNIPFKKNCDNVNKSIEVLNKLEMEREKTIIENRNGINYLINESNYEEINRIGFTSSKKKIKIPHYITWNFISKEERHKNEDHGFYEMMERIVSKKKIAMMYQNQIQK